MQMQTPSIGIIGLGYWGKNILRNLYELKAVAMACDSNPTIVGERKEKFPQIDYTLRFKDILDNAHIKAVVISTPAVTHYELAKEALCAGKDVFVEKPLALRYEHGEELVDIAQTNKKILMVGHILHYHPAIITLKEMIKNNDLGQMQYVYSNRLNIGKLRVEENILWSFAPHDISVILALIGEEPENVTCFGGNYLSRGVYDVTITSLEFKNNIRAHIFVSWLHPFKEQKLVVVGSKAMAVFDDMTAEKLFVYPHTIEWDSKKIPIARKAEYYPVAIKHAEPLCEELKHFCERITDRREPTTDGKEGLKVLKVLEKAEQSLNKIPEFDYHP